MRIREYWVGAVGTVLELGGGPGRDADRLEALGLAVLRSDATPAFVPAGSWRAR